MFGQLICKEASVEIGSVYPVGNTFVQFPVSISNKTPLVEGQESTSIGLPSCIESRQRPNLAPLVSEIISKNKYLLTFFPAFTAVAHCPGSRG